MATIVMIGDQEEILETEADWVWYRLNEEASHGYFKSKKAEISESDRWEIWERDNFTCNRCGSRKFLTIDHIIPESKGGLSEKSNYQTLCRKCNTKKGNRQ